jgi:hypothetical protein
MNAINVKYALIFTTLALAGCYSSSDTTNISDLRVLPQYKANMMAVEIRFETDRFITGKYDYPAIYATLTNTGNEDLSLSLSDLNIEADGAILSIVAPDDCAQLGSVVGLKELHNIKALQARHKVR